MVICACNGYPSQVCRRFLTRYIPLKQSDRSQSGKWIDGVVAGLSVHLQPGRVNPPKSSDIENIYVDIGASSAAEARKAGVDILSPLSSIASLPISATARWPVLLSVTTSAPRLLLNCCANRSVEIKGTLTVAFVVQQRTGARGLQRILRTTQADEMIYVGRLSGRTRSREEGVRRGPRRETGQRCSHRTSGNKRRTGGISADLKQLADANKIPFRTDYSALAGSAKLSRAPPMAARWAHLGLATGWADTPAEMIEIPRSRSLENLLQIYAQGESRLPLRRTWAGAAQLHWVAPSIRPPLRTFCSRSSQATV